MKSEIVADIRNKLQTTITVLEYMESGKSIPSNFINMALSDIEDVKELLQCLDTDNKSMLNLEVNK